MAPAESEMTVDEPNWTGNPKFSCFCVDQTPYETLPTEKKNTPNKKPGRRQGVVIGGQGAKLEPVVEAFVFELELGERHLKKRRAFS